MLDVHEPMHLPALMFFGVSGTGKSWLLKRFRQVLAEGPKLPSAYGDWLAKLEKRILAAQLKASLAVNRGLIELDWDIGREIVRRQEREGWGRSAIERLAGDLGREFPGVEGFSARNLW